MLRTPKDSNEHDALINMMVRHFSGQGFRNIKADIPDMPTPDLIYGTKKNHVPDLTADKNGIRIILEAETENSIFDVHTASQWSLFSDASLRSGGEFHVVVPKGSRDDVKTRAAELKVRIDEIWTPR
ncbi:MAG: hypothetical protein FJ135_01395 [Deltaproteobacteria bacterium]|nr:hypothetical protein [Deltaproteobacteria bacterium]